MSTALAVERQKVQRRTLRVLMLAQVVGSVAITIGIATASLLARDLSGSETLAGFAQTAQVLGAAGWAWWIGRLTDKRGRRPAQVTGWLIGAGGGLLAVVAGAVGSLPLLLVGAGLLGATTAANAAARYAATDLAAADQRGRSLATVVWATTVGAVAGPNLAGPAGGLARSLSLPSLTGPFLLAAVGMLAAAAILFVGLRPDPLLESRRLAPPVDPAVSPTRPVMESRGGVLIAAIAGVACAHAVMVSVMIMTPLHMEHGGAGLGTIGYVISVHVLGMFAFSPVVGWLSDRWGRSTVMLVGAAILFSSLLLCARSPEGSSWQISTGLFLLGLGWSCATVAGSTMVAELASPEHRPRIQGRADMAMLLMAAGGGALSGLIVGRWGFAALTGFAAVLACGVLAAGIIGARTAYAHEGRER